VKRGLNEPPLAAVEVALAGEQAFAERVLGATEGGAFDEVLVLRDEDVSYGVGVGEEIVLPVTDGELRGVAVVAGDVG